MKKHTRPPLSAAAKKILVDSGITPGKDGRAGNGRYTRSIEARLAEAKAHKAPMTKLRRMAMAHGYTLSMLARAARAEGLKCSAATLTMAVRRHKRGSKEETRPMPRETAKFICLAIGYPMSGWIRLSD